MKRTKIIAFIMAAVMFTAAFSSCIATETGGITKAEVVNVDFERSGEIVLNPGQGWILYGAPSNQSAETIALSSTGYQRFEWSKLNPSEGVYNWDPVDRAINDWKIYGKQLGFGVMSISTHGSAYGTPKWVFDKGAKFTMGNDEANRDVSSDIANRKFYVPVWDDPIYVAECEKFTKALAERYDGNPDVAFIDIRNYGNWGEVHMFPFAAYTEEISNEDFQELLVQPYIDNFKETQLIIPYCQGNMLATNDWAVENGLGLRRDGIMGKMGWGGSEGDEIAAYAKNIQPTIWELMGTYRGLEDASSANSRKWDDDVFVKIIQRNGPTYVGMGAWDTDAQYMYRKKTDMVKYVANIIGYHFIMKKAQYTNMVSADESKEISISIENTGTANMLTDCRIKLVLLDKDDKVVSSFTTDWDAGTFKSQETVDLKANVNFSGAPAGTYKLAIGFYRNENDEKPTYSIENRDKTKSGFYPIGDIRIK